jgi:hypothetical protein
MVTEPSLAAISAHVTDLVKANGLLSVALSELQPESEPGRPARSVVWERPRFGRLLLAQMGEAKRASFELKKATTLYIRRQPLLTGAAADEARPSGHGALARALARCRRRAS